MGNTIDMEGRFGLYNNIEPDGEVVYYWIDELESQYVGELIPSERLKQEIEDTTIDIQNNKLWVLGSADAEEEMMFKQNIANLKAYLDWLVEELEEIETAESEISKEVEAMEAEAIENEGD